MTEIIEVEATPIDTELTYQPATINAIGWIEYNAAKVARLMEPYSDIEKAVETMDLKAIKAAHADVNSVIKEIETQRKAIKSQYNKPLEAFNAMVEELLKPAKEAKETIAAARDEKEQALRDEKREQLQAIYEEYAPALVDLVPFSKICELKWLNVSTKMKAATEELYAKVDRIASDWESLKSMADSMAHFEECEREFFRTLDLGAATALNAKLVAEQQKIDALKAEVSANRAQQDEQAPSEALEDFAEACTAEPQEEPADYTPELFESQDVERTYVYTLRMTDSQREKLHQTLKFHGIHGSYKEVR